jgi:hypothetical protein
MQESERRLWILAAIALAVGVAMRINNAIQYRMLFGFDAPHNWVYIRYLFTKSWTMPAPDAGWSTAHPPFFYYLSAALCWLSGEAGRGYYVVLIRLMVSAFGLLIVLLAYKLVRRADPQNLPRALLAGGLVLFLPVHIYMSAMVTEEIVAAAFISLVIFGAGRELLSDSGARPSLWSPVWIGVAAGVAFMTKLTGVLIALIAGGIDLIDGWRRGTLGRAVARVSILLLVTAVVGGWWYARNFAKYGYLYPHGLEKHDIMLSMPPGDRELLDYARIPLATWTDPQVLNPDLLRSIWGSTYLTLWFDGHRAFLPTDTPDRLAVSRAGTVILLLALLPTAALLLGLWRGIRRAIRDPSSLDTLLISLVAVTLAGYVLFTWRNPWFAVHKASFMLSLSLPFGYYTSEMLDGWGRRDGWVGDVTWWGSLALVGAVVVTFTFSRVFWNMDHMVKAGVVW